MWMSVSSVPVHAASTLRHYLPEGPMNSTASLCTGETNGSTTLFATNTDLKESDQMNFTTKHLTKPNRNSPGGNFGQSIPSGISCCA